MWAWTRVLGGRWIIMFDRRRIKCCILLVLVVMVALHLHLGYFCADTHCALSSAETNTVQQRYLGNGVDFHSDIYHPHAAETCQHGTSTQRDSVRGQILFQNFSATPLDHSYRFNIDGEEDVLVFLHMQKTGGTTFGRHLVSDLEMPKPCQCRQGRKKCDCKNSRGLVWLVSRYSTGWRCGLHADWTELTSCVDGMLDKAEASHRHRRYMYISILRDPVTRYLSEYKHVQRGATWRAARLQCGGRQASLQEVPFCFEGDTWNGVDLDSFMDCPFNLANNRQTRMMANLSTIGCYNQFTDPNQQCNMLQSAKDNLKRLAFFGLTEYQLETQYMFEKTFGLKFKADFFQYNHTHSSEVTMSPSQRLKLERKNRLDGELYEYAKDLFFRRLYDLQKADSTFTGDRTLDVLSDNKAVLTMYRDEYDEGDENDAEDDDEYNNRIAHKYTKLNGNKDLKFRRKIASVQNRRPRDRHKQRNVRIVSPP